MSLKIDVSEIVRDHFKTLRTIEGQHLSIQDVALFYVVPAAIGVALPWKGVVLDSAAVNILITAFAIFTGLLFNLLLLAHGLVRKAVRASTPDDDRELLQQIYVNISYSILVAIVALVALVIEILSKNEIVTLVVSAISYFLVANFLLTLLMVLKRIHVVLDREFA